INACRVKLRQPARRAKLVLSRGSARPRFECDNARDIPDRGRAIWHVGIREPYTGEAGGDISDGSRQPLGGQELSWRLLAASGHERLEGRQDLFRLIRLLDAL